MSGTFASSLEVVAVGDELGLILPPELVEHLGAVEGDTLYPTKARGMNILPYGAACTMRRALPAVAAGPSEVACGRPRDRE